MEKKSPSKSKTATAKPSHQRHDLTLYHYWRSSCSWRVRWGLALKKLAYESVTVNLLAGEQRQQDFHRKSPTSYVPCLTIDGTPMIESLAILEWLEESYAHHPLLPSDPHTRLQVRSLCHLIGTGTQPLINLAVLDQITSDQSARQKWCHQWINRGLAIYENMITKTAGTYSVGGSLTMADICLVPQCFGGLRFGVNLDAFPKVKKIYERCLKLPECDASAPQNQPDAVPS